MIFVLFGKEEKRKKKKKSTRAKQLIQPLHAWWVMLEKSR
jgi:hypothetical protein